MKNKRIIENFLTWRALPTLITLGGIVLSFIVFIVTISNKVTSIEHQHTRIENKIDQLIQCK